MVIFVHSSSKFEVGILKLCLSHGPFDPTGCESISQSGFLFAVQFDVGNIGVGFFRHSNTGCNTHPLLIRMELSDWSAPTRPTEDNFSTAHFGQLNFTLERKRTCLNPQLYFCTIQEVSVYTPV